MSIPKFTNEEILRDSFIPVCLLCTPDAEPNTYTDIRVCEKHSKQMILNQKIKKVKNATTTLSWNTL